MGCSVPCWTRLSETECGCWRWPHTGFDPRGARAQRLARHRAWRVTFASFPARYPLSRGRFARRHFAVLLAAEEVACSPRLPRSPPHPCPPPGPGTNAVSPTGPLAGPHRRGPGAAVAAGGGGAAAGRQRGHLAGAALRLLRSPGGGQERSGGATGTALLRRLSWLRCPCPAVPCLPAGHDPLLPSDKPRHFFLGHSSGTNWVEYDATGWLNHVKHNPATQNASVLLQESQK